MDYFTIAGISVGYISMMIIIGNHYAHNGFGAGMVLITSLFWPLTIITLLLMKIMNPFLGWLNK